MTTRKAKATAKANSKGNSKSNSKSKQQVLHYVQDDKLGVGMTTSALG